MHCEACAYKSTKDNGHNYHKNVGLMKLPSAALRTIWWSKSLDPIEKPLEIADYVFCSHKK